MENLKGKIAVVTGATRGIGNAIAAELTEKGAEVWGSGTSSVSNMSQFSRYSCFDFSVIEDSISFAAELKSVEPDILINNAGINKIGSFTELELNDFLRIQQVNVTTPFLLSQAVLPGMKKKKWGRIVNITSIWGIISKEYRAPYSCSKFALDGMTAALAAEYSCTGILANSVAPGFIDTELTRKVLSNDQFNELSSIIPLKRLGSSKEIAKFVTWLAGPDNTYISGQNIAIDGGFTRV